MLNTSVPTLRFHYAYCDAHGYHNTGSQVVLNLAQITTEEAARQLLSFLHDGEFFLARQIKLPELFFDLPTVADHCWHTAQHWSVAEPTTDIHPDVDEFIASFKAAHRIGWREWYVQDDRRISITALPTYRNIRHLLLHHRHPFRRSIHAAYATWREDRLVLALLIEPFKNKSALAYTEEFHQQYATGWKLPLWQGANVDFQFFTDYNDPAFSQFAEYKIQ